MFAIWLYSRTKLWSYTKKFHIFYIAAGYIRAWHNCVFDALDISFFFVLAQYIITTITPVANLRLTPLISLLKWQSFLIKQLDLNRSNITLIQRSTQTISIHFSLSINTHRHRQDVSATLRLACVTHPPYDSRRVQFSKDTLTSLSLGS